MERTLYERPREKLRNKGVKFLTAIELLQLIIGSGYAKASHARIARQVMKLIDMNGASYKSLLSIGGLGDAKVCQILAVLEWGRRLNQETGQPTILQSYIDDVLLAAQKEKSNTLICYWFDGARQKIDNKTYEIDQKQHPVLLIRQMFADALATSPRSVLVVIRTHTIELVPSTSDLTLMQTIKDIARVLSVEVIDIYAVDKKKMTKWSKEVQ